MEKKLANGDTLYTLGEHYARVRCARVPQDEIPAEARQDFIAYRIEARNCDETGADCAASGLVATYRTGLTVALAAVADGSLNDRKAAACREAAQKAVNIAVLLQLEDE